MEFQTFDADYVQRLATGDPSTESHFSVYFGKFLSLKLRSRGISNGTADDVRQETLYRVLKVLRNGPGIAQPERFGGFVNAVCNNVLLEMHRKASRDDAGGMSVEAIDQRIDIDQSLVHAERRRIVRDVLKRLSEKDREILRLIFFEDADRTEISRIIGVEPEYLRVLLHRAKSRFEESFVRRYGALTSIALLLCNGIILNATICQGMQ